MATMGNAVGPLRDVVAAVYRAESRRILATLIRLVGDFDLAEDSLQEAFKGALEQWPRDGVPVNPRAWLISAGRFKAIDRLRRSARFTASMPLLAGQLEAAANDPSTGPGDEAVEDDRLREQLGGYFLVEAGDLDEAIAVAARIPGARVGMVEIRPVMEIAGLPAGAPRPKGGAAAGMEGRRG